MTSFQSNEEFFQAVQNLLAKLDGDGLGQAADELREGYRCLNGLTDGAALFLDAIERVQVAYSARLAPEDRETLGTLRAAVRKAVKRR